jgi:hypothetical protein
MERKRIYFTAWGRGRFAEPRYAISSEADGRHADGERVASAIARKSGLSVATLRPDGLNDGLRQYQATLGRRVRTGGWSPVAEISFVIEDDCNRAIAHLEGDNRCNGCGRVELDCSQDPCAAVLADREGGA